jgi:uncharacterized membrane protein YgdD (TMEM256/DUF423 family)
LSLGSRPEFATIAAMQHRVALALAGILGATGVAMGAFGAHALRATLEAAGTRSAWETGVSFQLVHAVALLGFAGWLRAGTVVFSGSLYALALGGPRWLGPVTPLGGTALIAGWVLAAAAALAA